MCAQREQSVRAEEKERSGGGDKADQWEGLQSKAVVLALGMDFLLFSLGKHTHSQSTWPSYAWNEIVHIAKIFLNTS